MLPKETHCPAARRIVGAIPANSGVVCGVIQNDRLKEKGLGMDPAQTAIARAGGTGDVFLTLKSDPSTVERLCCGDGVPVIDDRGGHARDSYTFCPVWQAEQKRIWAGRDELRGGGVVADPVEHYDDGARTGLNGAPVGSTYDSKDPWAQGRKDLDVLAPVKQGG